MKSLRKIKLSDFRSALALSLFAGVFIFWNLGRNALIDWDESIYAAVAREMAEGGDWLTLYWNREFFFEKPPLYFWLTAGLYKLFGISEFTARFWSAFFGVLGVGAIYYFGKKLFDRKTGILSALVLATTIHWIFQSRNATLDVPAATLIIISLYFFWCAWSSRDVPPGRLYRYWSLFGVFLGLTFMVKGPVAAIPIAIAGLFALVDVFSGDFSFGRDWKYFLRSLLLVTGYLLLTTLPWHLLMYFKYRDQFINEYFFYHMLARARMEIEEHGHPFLWYLIVFKHWARLWTVLLLLSLPVFLGRIFKGMKMEEARGLLFSFLWLVFTFLVLSSSVSKIQWYIIPIYPPMAILCGRFLVFSGRGASNLLGRWLAPAAIRYFWHSFFFAVLVFGVSGLFLSKDQWYLDDYNRGFAEASKVMAKVSREDDSLLVAGSAPGVPIFYSSRKVRTAKVDQVYQPAVRGKKFFAITRQQILEDIERLYPDSGVEVFYRDLGYALYGRR